jgi:predicted ATPase
MINSVEIERLRGIRNGKLENLTPLTVLVGPNGCGKSTILDAFLIGANRRPGHGVGQAVARRMTPFRSAEWLFWKSSDSPNARVSVERGTAKQQCSLSIHPNSTDDTLIVVCHISSNLPGIQKAQVTVHFKAGDNFSVSDASFRSEIFSEPPLLETWRGAMQTPLHQVYSQAAVQGRKKQAIEMARAVVDGLEDVEVLTDERNVPYVALTVSERAVPAALQGDGVHALLRLCLELAAEPGGLVLIEEPEIHQHPAAIQQTMKAVLAAVSRGVQVILSTHSLDVIDAIVAEADDDILKKLSLYRLRLDAGELFTSRLSGEDVTLSRTQIEDDLR